MKEKSQVIDPDFVAVSEDGRPEDMSVLDKQDVAYDPTQMTVDLTKAEKRRTTALMLAIQAYQNLIIKDAEMYRAISTEAMRNNGPVIQPATMSAMVEAAIEFDHFISGRFDIDKESPIVVERSQSPQAENATEAKP